VSCVLCYLTKCHPDLPLTLNEAHNLRRVKWWSIDASFVPCTTTCAAVTLVDAARFHGPCNLCGDRIPMTNLYYAWPVNIPTLIDDIFFK
jgi:hypothetical protein